MLSLFDCCHFNVTLKLLNRNSYSIQIVVRKFAHMKKVELAQTVLNQQELIFFFCHLWAAETSCKLNTDIYHIFQLIANLLGNIVYY